MLIRQYRGGHQHSHLFIVAGSLEGRTYGHLRLTESHITTYQTVHRTTALHIPLHILCGFQLVGGILIEEASLQLMLHEGVVTVCETFLFATGSV